MYKISLRRQGAWKWISCTTDNESLLSLCQVFESTKDVEEYMVGEVGKYFEIKDRYLPSDSANGFPKWKPIPKGDETKG